jgi:hypothetical protein
MSVADNHRRTKTHPAVWVMLALILAVNLWFDYHHPIWLVIDAIVLAAVGFSWLAKAEGDWF